MKQTGYIGALLILPVLKGLVTLATVFVAYRLRGKKMEQKIGDVGVMDESYAKGVASVTATISVPSTSYGLSIKISAEADLDAKILIGYLAGKIGGPIPAEVAAFLENALAIA